MLPDSRPKGHNTCKFLHNTLIRLKAFSDLPVCTHTVSISLLISSHLSKPLNTTHSHILFFKGLTFSSHLLPPSFPLSLAHGFARADVSRALCKIVEFCRAETALTRDVLHQYGICSASIPWLILPLNYKLPLFLNL